MLNDVKEILINEKEILSIIKGMGAKITNDYQGKDLVLIGVLKGAAPFMMDLIKEIKLPIQIDFMQISSYEGTKSGQLKLKKDIDVDVEGKDVLIVDDIVDTGKTSSMITELFKERKAKSIEFATLLDKKENRVVDFEPKYVGQVIPNLFVIGYGLDFNEKYRNLPFIGILKEELYK